MEDDPDGNAFYQMILQHDKEVMPPPPMDFQADTNILLAKVRRHYYQYVISLLSQNYASFHKLPKDSVRLPSAIYKCAKDFESKAAQACMLLQLYRENIVTLIKQVKTDTEKKRLNKHLLEHLTLPQRNEKSVQVNFDKSTTRSLKPSKRSHEKIDQPLIKKQSEKINDLQSPHSSQNLEEINYRLLGNNVTEANGHDSSICNIPDTTGGCHSTFIRASIESNSEEMVINDHVLRELEAMFKDITNGDEDDLFEGTVCDSLGVSSSTNVPDTVTSSALMEASCEAVDHATTQKIKSLDERLAMLENCGVLKQENGADVQKEPPPAKKSHRSSTYSKWLCEQYHQRLELSQILDEIRELSVRRLSRIKTKFLDLFGEDSEDEEMVSPAEENVDFVMSCKERIAPWIVQNLMPYFKRGRILNKHLFKAVAKHSLNIIIEGNRYPDEYEVHSFVKRFFQRHPKIRCEADFKYSLLS